MPINHKKSDDSQKLTKSPSGQMLSLKGNVPQTTVHKGFAQLTLLWSGYRIQALIVASWKSRQEYRFSTRRSEKTNSSFPSLPFTPSFLDTHTIIHLTPVFPHSVSLLMSPCFSHLVEDSALGPSAKPYHNHDYNTTWFPPFQFYYCFSNSDPTSSMLSLYSHSYNQHSLIFALGP